MANQKAMMKLSDQKYCYWITFCQKKKSPFATCKIKSSEETLSIKLQPLSAVALLNESKGQVKEWVHFTATLPFPMNMNGGLSVASCIRWHMPYQRPGAHRESVWYSGLGCSSCKCTPHRKGPISLSSTCPRHGVICSLCTYVTCQRISSAFFPD